MLKKKEISLTLSPKQWYSQSFSYHSLIKSSSELQIIQIIKKRIQHTPFYTADNNKTRGGGRKEGRKGGR